MILSVARRLRLKFGRFWSLPVLAGFLLASGHLLAAEPDVAAPATEAHYNVTGYAVSGSSLLSTNLLNPVFAKYTGTNVTLQQVLMAASDLHYEFCKIGQSAMSVAIARHSLTNGVVTLNVFKTVVPQVVVSGECYLRFTNAPATEPASPAEMADARTALRQTLAELKKRDAEMKARAADTRVHVVSTNAGPRFAVDKYLVMGNTILTPRTIGQTLTNIDGAFGTNVSFEGVSTAVSELQKAYRERGYVTVAVSVPPQKLTHAEVKLQVTEGRLARITVTGNRYFSSNNVMRALPSLHPNMLLNGPVFQAELNRANGNQDRQIYPVIGPGPTSGTSALALKVKDRLPLHAKLGFNNQSSPGTPDERVNASAMYDNLWQHENSLGLQYGFSPEAYKVGNQWNFYDQPIVAYYSAFYRLPLGNPQAVADTVANHPGSFGYNEATHQFRLPAPSGQPELTFYANRATIDTGVETPSTQTLGTNLTEQTTHQDLTINEGVGFQLAKPLPEVAGIRSFLSGGLDFKVYDLTSYGTNIFTSTSLVTNSGTVYTTTNTVLSPIPTTHTTLDYLPLALNYSANFQDPLGPATLELGLSVNLAYSSPYETITTHSSTEYSTNSSGVISTNQVTKTTTESSGHWVILKPSFSQEFDFYTNWPTTLQLDGQWASEPLISIEQFGAGGVNSVRGYHEGEVFGDDGWHLSLEQHTPSYTVGMIRDGTPLTVRGSVYWDYANVYLIDPPTGAQSSTSLSGTGFGFSASAGSHWQAQFLFSWPLISTSTTPAFNPFFNFALTAQF